MIYALIPLAILAVFRFGWAIVGLITSSKNVKYTLHPLWGLGHNALLLWVLFQVWPR